jgi:prepilin-type N-terminal cleavage/methylation domain-containing protein
MKIKGKYVLRGLESFNGFRGFKGFTLIEMTISLFILAMISLSLGLSSIAARKYSEAAVMQSIAMSMAVSYMEQIKSMDYSKLVNACASPATVPLPTMIDDITSDPLYLNIDNTKTFAIDINNSGAITKKMTMTVKPTLTDLSGSLNLTAVEVILNYSWTAADSKVPHNRAMRSVRSYIPSY